MTKQDIDKPVRKGFVYCSPRCGMGCSHKDYLEAKEKARRLANRLGKGWRIRVWDNLGWHWEVRKGKINIDVNEYLSSPTSYDCWVVIEGTTQSLSNTQFSKTRKTPEKAISAVAEEMERHVKAVQKSINNLL
ncbi:hypothetical protein KAR91_66820 [Candidatus Pacearchaeota archaeon]|nr:hypothetical protein [Candidatus Pacearchaeota archaeon]